MNILGISCFYHDSAACLVVDGSLVAAVQEERFTRRKHDSSFPRHSVSYCLQKGKIDRLDFVVFYEKPWLKFGRILSTYLWFAPRGLRSFRPALALWLRKRAWMAAEIRINLRHSGIRPGYKLHFCTHHLSHAASAFYPSPFPHATVLTIDGVGEWATATIAHGQGNKIELLKSLTFPHSLGLLYSTFTYLAGFQVNSGEYKLMGLAPYGTPCYTQFILDHLIDLKEDGSFRLNMDYFGYCTDLTMTTALTEKAFGGSPRKPESRITQREMDLAASIQAVTNEIVIRMARHAVQVTGSRNLCLAGGVALNCVANGRLARSGICDDLWIQPAAGDAGGALGCALHVWHYELDKPRVPKAGEDLMQGAYLGPGFSDYEIQMFLDQHGYPYAVLDPDAWAPTLASLVNEGNVIGIMQGRMEFGPRALGNRSIVADARSPRMQSVLNLKIKFREGFRPFAPACLEDRAADFFELDRPSPYMLLVADVRREHRKVPDRKQADDLQERLNQVRSDIPAVTHVDYSARIQTVSAKTNPRFAALLHAMQDLTGYPIVINTSFNVRDEPIVCTPVDAYSCFIRTEMDYLSLGSFLLRKTDQPSKAPSSSLGPN